jgi:zinc transporter
VEIATADTAGFGKIRIYVDERRMITLRRDRLQTADRLRRELARGSAVADTPATLFHRYLEDLAITVGAVVTKLSDIVDDAEDEIFAGRYRQQGPILGRVRREIARLRRHVNADRTALASLRGRVPPPLEAAQADLVDAVGRLDAVAQDLELVQERTRLLQEEIAGRLGEATNRNLEVLSLATTALLPITLITGVFGMNVGGLPGVNHPHGFRWVMLAIVVAIGAVVTVIFRRRQR